MRQFRDLTANEINVRVAMVKNTERSKGVSLLLYKDARCDANILDETVGVENWSCRFYECKGNLFCSLGIYDPGRKEFIYKDDCGSESYTEKEKGEASDAFKRAAFKFGIGRELYTAPFIWVKDCNIRTTTKNGKEVHQCDDKFRVKHIKIENKKITELVIYNETTKSDCFKYGIGSVTTHSHNISDTEAKQLLNLIEEKGANTAKILKYYKAKDLRDLTEAQYNELGSSLNK